MGTDWRNHAADVEPMVEIYQGAGQNYERPGAPRAPTARDSIGEQADGELGWVSPMWITCVPAK